MGFQLVGTNETVDSEPDLAAMAQRLWDEFELRHGIQQWRLQLQDSWLLSYLVFDASQNDQPPGRERYYSPRISSVVDTARRVLTRNPIKYHLVSQHYKADDRMQREPQRKLENVLHGMQYDIDRQLLGRGELNARQQAAFGGLVRGAWAYKYHLSTQAKTSTGSPQSYNALDSRQVLPLFDDIDIQSGISFTTTTLNTLLGSHEDEVRPLVESYITALKGKNSGGKVDYTFAHTALTQLEFSSRTEHGVLVDLAGLPNELTTILGINSNDRDQSGRWLWVEKPFLHGFGRSLIRYGNVNGVPAGMGKQDLGSTTSPLVRSQPIYRGGTATEGQTNILRPNGNGVFDTPSMLVDTGAPMAGRSIFAMVQHLIPELNRFVALMKQAVTNEVRGTWVFQSRDGKMIPMEIGQGSINPMTLQSQLSKVDPHIGAIDMIGILQVVNQEISDGSLDLRFVLASETEGSGHLRARLEQAALVATEDYLTGLQNWAVDLADSFSTQFRSARKGSYSKWEVSGRTPGSSTKFFVVDIDGEISDELKESKEPPVFEATVKSAMPIDMMARINMAKAAIDPNNPIMSLAMALDIIMEFDDAEAAYDSILQDIGRRNPTIVLLEISQAMARGGAPEVAQMLLDDAFRASFAQASAAQQGATVTPAGSTPGIQPGVTPPEITSGGGTEQMPNSEQAQQIALAAGGR